LWALTGSDEYWEVLSFWNLKLAGKKIRQHKDPIKDYWLEP
jgi:hypothetical protein